MENIALSTKKTIPKKSFVLNTPCNSCENNSCLIRRNINSEAMSQLAGEKRVIKCKKGQQFIMEGAPVNGLFFILNGKVKVYRTGLNGKEQIVRLAKEGEIIGHRGFGTEEYYTIGAMALEDATLCYFSKGILQIVLKRDAPFAYDLMLFYADELNKSEAKVKSLSQMTVRERVIDTLLYISRKFGHSKELLSLTLSRKEYADYAGTTEEQVIRILSMLKKEKLIHTSGKKIGILDTILLRKEINKHNYYLEN